MVMDDTHMTSIKIVQFLRPPTPLSICFQNSSTPLTLDVQFQTNLPSLLFDLTHKQYNVIIKIVTYCKTSSKRADATSLH